MKYLGCIMILCGCIVLSDLYKSNEIKKINYLSCMRDFIIYLENKISLFLTPKHILFKEYNKEPIRSLILNDFNNINSYFDKDIATALKELIDTFGHGLKDEQINKCKYTRSLLEESQKKAESELKNKIKIFRTLALFIGATLTILII